ncbi:MAG: hypothetical protein KatS3mg090_0693 [Patescibacteria group bacterium]|nr:MAG: hypothetical protein KatS3mg090_0693 [Patescibacteria group bacterium]
MLKKSVLIALLLVVGVLNIKAILAESFSSSSAGIESTSSAEFVDAYSSEDGFSNNEAIIIDSDQTSFLSTNSADLNENEKGNKGVNENSDYLINTNLEVLDQDSRLVETFYLDDNNNFSAVRKNLIYVFPVFKKDFSSEEDIVVRIGNITSRDNLSIFLEHSGGKRIIPKYELFQKNNYFVVRIQSNQDILPGEYRLVVYDKGSNSSAETEFSWGVLALNTDRYVYMPGETVNIGIAVLDKTGMMVCDAGLELSVSNEESGSSFTLSTSDGSIKVNEECLIHNYTEKPDYETSFTPSATGNYLLRLKAETKDGQWQIESRIIVVDDRDFDLERQGPTRIYPPKFYPYYLKIKTKSGFRGKVREYLPESFSVININQSNVVNYSRQYVKDLEGRQTVDGSVKEFNLPNLGLPFSTNNFVITTYFGSLYSLSDLNNLLDVFKLKGHDGIDFKLEKGVEILSVDEGKVLIAGESDYGQTVVIEHSWGKSYYGHLSNISVSVGTVVKKGDKIGLVGSTGISTGVHLHFSIKPNQSDINNGFGGKIDPLPYLPLVKADNQVFAVENRSEKKVRVLEWSLDLDSGDEIVLGYMFKSPNISPQLYNLGPVEIYDLGDNILYSEQRSWMIAADAVGDYAIYRESTGGEDISTSGVDLDWDTSVYEGSAFSKQSNNTDLKLNETGHYLVIYNLGLSSSGGSNRSRVSSKLKLNTNFLPYGRASCYIRRTQGVDECYLAGGAIIYANSNDNLRINAERVDNNSATVQRNSNESGVFILRLDDSWDYLRSYDSAGGQSFDSTTFATVSFNTDDEIDTNSFSRSGGDITLKQTGHYLVLTNVTFNNTSVNTRRSNEIRLTLGGAEIPGTRTTAYILNANNTQIEPAVYMGIIENTTANSVLKVEAACSSESCGGVETVANETAITIVKLPDSADYLRIYEQSGGQNVDGTDDPILWDTNQEVDSSFSHSTSTNTSRIIINSSGNFLFLSSFYVVRQDQTNAFRLYPHWSWRLNGNSKYQYGSFGQYSRGDQSIQGVFTAGNSGGIIAHSLSVNDYIELINTDESTSTDSNAVFYGQRYAVQGVSLDSLFPSNPEINQIHYRIRDDSTALNTSGGWLALEDQKADVALLEPFRIRVEVANEGQGADSVSRQYEIQWAEKGSAVNCASVSSWFGVEDSSSDAFSMYNSSYITSDGQSITSGLLSNSEGYTFAGGQGRDISDTTSSISALSVNNYIELEFSLVSTNYAVIGESYCFRVYDKLNNEPLHFYLKYPEIRISGTSTFLDGLEWGYINNVTDSGWTTINFVGKYTDPIFICSVVYANNIGLESDSDADSVVCRGNSLSASSVDIRLQKPGSSSLASGEKVFYLVAEKGVYDTGDIKMEAFSYTSTVTDGAGSWVGQQQSYSQEYSNPVVLGQVMSFNDTRWSMFYSAGSVISNPPSSSVLYTGKHIGEDSPLNRSNEEVGVIVVEESSGSLNNIPFIAELQSRSIDRIDDSPPSSYTFSQSFSSTPQVAIISVAGIYDNDGAVPLLYGSSPLSTTSINLAIAEDEINDGEMTGNQEYVPYLVFQSSGSYKGYEVVLDQDTFRFYENTDAVNPSTAIANENSNITDIAPGDILRLRLSLQVGRSELKTAKLKIKLQYAESDDCSTAVNWFDVGSIGSSSVWRFYDNPSVSNGATITSSLLNSQTNSLQSYQEANASVYNPNSVSRKSRGEWDFVLENNRAEYGANFCFRVVDEFGNPINYSVYPQVTTVVSEKYMKHGKWFNDSGVLQPYSF